MKIFEIQKEYKTVAFIILAFFILGYVFYRENLILFFNIALIIYLGTRITKIEIVYDESVKFYRFFGSFSIQIKDILNVIKGPSHNILEHKTGIIKLHHLIDNLDLFAATIEKLLPRHEAPAEKTESKRDIVKSTKEDENPIGIFIRSMLFVAFTLFLAILMVWGLFKNLGWMTS